MCLRITCRNKWKPRWPNSQDKVGPQTTWNCVLCTRRNIPCNCVVERGVSRTSEIARATMDVHPVGAFRQTTEQYLTLGFDEKTNIN